MSGSTSVEKQQTALPLFLFGTWLLITTGWWWAAFYQLPISAPTWLARAQAICFGLAPSGLPETYGWWQLILAPLSLLAALIAVWGVPLAHALRKVSHRWPGRVVLVVVLVVVAAEVSWIGGRIADGLAASGPQEYPAQTGPFPIDYPRQKKIAPPIELTQAGGAPFRLQDLQGSPVVITFAYGLCDTICPVLVERARQGVMESEIAGARLVVVTLDPWRDRVSSLPGIAQRWKVQNSAILVSGPVEDVEDVLTSYRVPRSRDLSNGEITHPPLVIVIDAQGRLAYTLSNPSALWISEAVRRAS